MNARRVTSITAVTEEKLNESVADTLRQMSPEELTKLTTEPDRATAPTEDDIARYRVQDNQLQQRLRRLEELFRDGLIEREDYWSRKSAYQRERLELRECIERTQERTTGRQEQVFRKLCAHAGDVSSLTTAERRLVVRRLLADRHLDLASLRTETQSDSGEASRPGVDGHNMLERGKLIQRSRRICSLARCMARNAGMTRKKYKPTAT